MLRRLAGETLDVIRSVPGAADTSIEQEADQAQLRLAVDRAVLARYGLNITDVQEVIELAIGGRAVGAVFEGEQRFESLCGTCRKRAATRQPSAKCS